MTKSEKYNFCWSADSRIFLILALGFTLVSLFAFLCAGFARLLAWIALLVGAAVEEIHLRESLVDFHEDACQLLVVHIVGNYIQNCAQLLILLLQAQFLVHVCDALLQSGLKGGDLVAKLLLLIFCCIWFLECSFQLIYAGCRLLAVVGEALHLATTFHSSRHVHSSVHLLRDLSQRGHILRSVVSKIETYVQQIYCSISLLVGIG